MKKSIELDQILGLERREGKYIIQRRRKMEKEREENMKDRERFLPDFLAC